MTYRRFAVAFLAATLVVGSASTAQNLATNYATAVAAVGDEILIGEPDNHYRPGTVYVYKRSASGHWDEIEHLLASDADLFDGFGASLAADDGILVVGALRQNEGKGAVYVFGREDGRWTETARLTVDDAVAADRFGAAVDVEGDLIVVGAPATTRYGSLTPPTLPGSAFVFERAGDGWRLASRLEGSGAGIGAEFGRSVAISRRDVLVGAPHQNAAYVFSSSGSRWKESQMLTSDERSLLGLSLSTGKGGVYAGAPGASRGVGAVHVYQKNEGSWSSVRTLVPFDGVASTGFGAALSAHDSQLWVGAPFAMEGRGDVYRFELGDAASTERLHAGTIRGAHLGAALAASSGFVVAAVPKGEGLEGTAVVVEQVESGSWATAATLRGQHTGLDVIAGDKVECTDGKAALFDCSRVDLLAFLPLNAVGASRGVNVNDLWGWTDPITDREYVLLGRTNGTSFVDISDPTAPVYVGDLPLTPGASPTTWRDIKVFKDHAFVVADNTPDHGMQVFDLARLRNVQNPPKQYEADVVYDGLENAHNVAINEETGFAFAVGGDKCGGGLHMVDIRNPKQPTFAGCFAHPNTGHGSTGSTHDTQCVTYRGPDADYRGREICFSSNGTALSIADVTDKDHPKALSATSYPNFAYVHQGWLTEDQRYFYLNDELDEFVGNTPETRTLIWDVSDLEDPQLVSEYTFGTEAADHNLYVKGSYMYQSNYLSGLRIHDITDPENPREVAYFDTVPVGTNDSRLDGSWSNYPYFKSGVIAVSSQQEGLFLVKMAGEPGL